MGDNREEEGCNGAGDCLGEVGATKDRRLHAEKTWPSHIAKQMSVFNLNGSKAILIDRMNYSCDHLISEQCRDFSERHAMLSPIVTE